MKTRIFTICIMVAALAMFAPVAEAAYRVTGGGWIPVDDSGDSKATLVMNVISKSVKGVDIITGKVQYIDHDSNFKLNGSVIYSSDPYYDKDKGVWHLLFSGNYRLQSNGDEGAFWLDIESGDSEDLVSIIFYDPDEPNPWYSNTNFLGGGNIQVHLVK